MSEALVQLLDLDLGWTRTIADITERRTFVRHPYELELVQIDLQAWLAQLRDLLRADRYYPSPMLFIDVPKGRGGVRSGAYLTLPDRVVYASLVAAALPNIERHLAWAQGTVDFSYQLRRTRRGADWFRSRFLAWREFRESSLRRVHEGLPYVVMTDISDFYDSIDIATLLSDLRQMDTPEALVTQLSACLNRWADPLKVGIPQGQSASDVLAKVYLNSVDRNLRAMDYGHFRYVDDYRIFCNDKVRAKRALLDLTGLLRKRGLSLQAAKSEILRSDEARTRIEGVLPTLSSLSKRFVEAIARHIGANPYMSVPEAEQALLENPDDAPLELIRATYKTYLDLPRKTRPVRG
jgi:retron-type reverse transcriptase